MSGYEKRRLERLSEVKKDISSKGYDKEKVISKYCMLWGTSRRTIMEYIKIIENSL